MNIDSIKKPGLLIDIQKVNRNIKKFKEKSELNKLIFRPHFKTHQSVRIGELFKGLGVQQITVSSVSMAKYFMRNGWTDITIAFPLNAREISEIKQLAKFIRINTLITSKEQIEVLKSNIKFQIGFFIKIDTGFHRSGLEPDQWDAVDEILNLSRLNNKLIFKGFLSHFGNTYQAQSKKEIVSIYNSSLFHLLQLKEKYKNEYAGIIISVGDTPSCSVVEDFRGVDEIRPGNFVYYDMMQKKIGSCTESEIAVAVACPVIDKNLKRNELLIYGGAVHLSKEHYIDNQGNKSFGSIVELSDKAWSPSVKNAFVKSISQEHGLVQCTPAFLKRINPGSLIGVLPVHACLTAHLLKENKAFINARHDFHLF